MIDVHTTGWMDVLQAFDLSRPILDGRTVQCWESGLIEELGRRDLLNELPPATCLACTECSESPFRDIIFTETVNGTQRALLPCPNCGLCEVPVADLRRWQLDRSTLAQWIRASLVLSVRLDEVVAGRLWRLGRLKKNGLNATVWLGLQSWRGDLRDQLCQAIQTSGSLLLVPGRRPTCLIPDGVLVGVLTELTDWQNGQLVWDDEQLHDLLGTNGGCDRRQTKPAPVRRQTRAADIEALVSELREHLRSARDYAFHTLDTTGVPQLLPRPSQKDLAQRLGITESRISRSIHDEEAQQLKLLWELADDIEGIMRFGR